MISTEKLMNYPNYKKKGLKHTELIFWVHYYSQFPVALLSIFLEKVNGNEGEIIVLESVSFDLCPMGLGYVYSNSVLPLIFGDNKIFNNYFINYSKKSIHAMSTTITRSIFPKDLVVSEKLTKSNINEAFLEAKSLNENLKAGDRIIFLTDYLKEYVLPGLVAEIVSVDKAARELVVRPIFESFKVNKLSPRKITVPIAICVPIYYNDNKYLGPPVDIQFYSDKCLEFNKI